MALVNSPDVGTTIIAETIFATTPSTGATRYYLPLAAEQSLLSGTATTIASNANMPNRASNGSRRGMRMVDGGFELRFQKAPFMDVLLQSALSNTFATNVLKAGTNDKSFSVLSVLQPGNATNALVKAFKGCMVNGFTLNSKGNEGVTINFDVMGADFENLTTDNALTVTAVPNTATEFVGSEVSNISVAGQSLSFYELSLDTKLDRTRRPLLGTDASLAFGVNGSRTTTVTVKAYRDSFALETAVSGAAQAVTFDVISSGNGYRFTLPAAYGAVPQDEQADGSAFVTVTFTAGYDATANTDLIVTRL